MNRQQAIKMAEFRVIYPTDVRPNLEVLPLEEVKNIIRQIHEPQKPVVPKFVAEWIKKHKDKGYRLAHTLEKVFDDAELSLYIKQQEGDYTETIAKAWLAYPNITVEQEKLYTVEIPNPALDNLEFVIVLKRIRGRVCLVITYDYMGRELSDEYKLTEAEIKQDFEWAWNAGFAKEVQ